MPAGFEPSSQLSWRTVFTAKVVKKDRIPKALKERYGLENLFVEALPSFWRLLYTIVRDRGERYIVVVEIVDHKAYDRWFPGRGR